LTRRPRTTHRSVRPIRSRPRSAVPSELWLDRSTSRCSCSSSRLSLALLKAKSQSERQRFVYLEAIVMHPRRWNWILSGLDSSSKECIRRSFLTAGSREHRDHAGHLQPRPSFDATRGGAGVRRAVRSRRRVSRRAENSIRCGQGWTGRRRLDA